MIRWGKKWGRFIGIRWSRLFPGWQAFRSVQFAGKGDAGQEKQGWLVEERAGLADHPVAAPPQSANFTKARLPQIFPKAPREPQTARNAVNSGGMWLPSRNFLASLQKIPDQLLLFPSKGRTHP